MRLEDMLKNVSGITNKVIKENCWEGQFNVLEGIQVLQSKINEVITAINDGIIKGDKGDTPNVQVGETTTLDPNSKAIVTQTGDMLNPILNFGIPKGDKGDKGDTGKASESIQDEVVGKDTCWSSEKTVGYVDNMFNSLQDVKGVKYSTDKEYLIATGSKNGVVKDLKVYGKSLVNIYDTKRKPFDTSGNSGQVIITNNDVSIVNPTSYRYARFYSIIPFNPSNTYTFIIDVLENTTNSSGIFIETNNGTGMNSTEIRLKTGLNVFKLSGISELSNSFRLFIGSAQTATCKISRKIVVLEGDHTQNTPSYFEGIASVGNGNGIEVLCTNGNILNKDKLLSISTTVFPTIKNNGFEVDYSSVISIPYYEVRCIKNMLLNLDVIKKGSGDIIVRGYKNVEDIKTSSNFTFSKGISLTGNITGIQIPIGTNFIAFQRGNASTGLVEIDNIMITFDSSTVKYISHLEDKKPILFKDTDNTWKPVTELRGLDLNNCDTIEQHSDGKHYLHVRTGTRVLNGSEGWTQQGTNDALTLRCAFVDSLCNGKNTVVSDKFSKINIVGMSDVEGVFINSDRGINLFILKSKLETQDVNGFKKYLQNNNVTVIYRLFEEKVYEVNPLDLESFENETMILFKYGVVSGSSEFYIDSNLGSITLENMKRLSRIENEIYQVKKVVLNGDYRSLAYSTYPEDFKEVGKHE